MCPCGDEEEMPAGGVERLPRDWIAAQQAAMDRVTKSGGVQCRHSDGSCEEMATGRRTDDRIPPYFLHRRDLLREARAV